MEISMRSALFMFFVLLLSNELMAQNIVVLNGQPVIIPPNTPHMILVEQPPYYSYPVIRQQIVINPPAYIQPVPYPYVIEKQYWFRRERIVIYPQYITRFYE